MAKRSRVITMSPLEDDLAIDLDLWEVVNPSDGEYSDDSFSLDSLSDDDVISLGDDCLESLSVVSPPLPEMIAVEEDGGGVITADLDLDVDEKGEDEENEEDGDGDGNDVYSDEIDENGVGLAQRKMIIVRGGTLYSVGAITYNRDVSGYDDGDDDRGSDYGEYDESYDLDEEIVPRNGSKKLGRGKVKRTITKVTNSKKIAYAHLKAAACVRGKRGLGLKFKY